MTTDRPHRHRAALRPRVAWLLGAALFAGALLIPLTSRLGRDTSAAANRPLEPTTATAPPTTSPPPAIQAVTTATVAPDDLPSDDIAYGRDPAQRLDILRPVGPTRGTILYFHSGGWCCGDKLEVNSPILALVDSGWTVVSANYRTTTTGHRAAELIGDADQAVRFVRADADRLGLDTSTLVVSGSSAGGHLALMVAAAPGQFTNPDLPPDLAAVAPELDGVIDIVGPSDLETFYLANLFAVEIQEDLLGCALPSRSSTWTQPCTPETIARFSPKAWAEQRADAGDRLPPAWFIYGDADTLVRPDTQAHELRRVWASGAEATMVGLDLRQGAGHNLEDGIDTPALLGWLDRVVARSTPSLDDDLATSPVGSSR